MPTRVYPSGERLILITKALKRRSKSLKRYHFHLHTSLDLLLTYTQILTLETTNISIERQRNEKQLLNLTEPSKALTPTVTLKSPDQRSIRLIQPQQPNGVGLGMHGPMPTMHLWIANLHFHTLSFDVCLHALIMTRLKCIVYLHIQVWYDPIKCTHAHIHTCHAILNPSIHGVMKSTLFSVSTQLGNIISTRGGSASCK